MLLGKASWKKWLVWTVVSILTASIYQVIPYARLYSEHFTSVVSFTVGTLASPVFSVLPVLKTRKLKYSVV